MKNKILLMISLVFFLIFLNGVLAISDYCGDGVCANYEYYNETNPLDRYYCPTDCDVLISSRWCEDTYGLREGDCPSCGGCSECTLSKIPVVDKNNWCSSNGYSSGSSSCQASNGADSTNMNKYSWIIFLIIGGIIGYYYKKKNK